MRTFRSLILFFVCLVPALANAQSDSARSKLSVRIGTYYNSYLNYYGRTDSLQSTGFFPLAELWLKNKFYINAAPVFTNNKLNGTEYAGAVSTIGYLNNNSRSSVHVYLVKPIYKSNSQLVQSALKAQLAGSFTELNKILNITMGADLKLSDRLDYGANLGIDHIFKKQLKKQVVFIADPSLYVYAGTQRFTQTRLEKKGFLLLPGVEQQVTDEVSRFSVLSYELTMPLIVAKGKWMLIATPSYVIPQNLVAVNDAAPPERGVNKIYVVAGLRVTL